MPKRLYRTYTLDYCYIDSNGLSRPAFFWYMMQDTAVLHAAELDFGQYGCKTMFVLSRAELTLCRPLRYGERVRCDTRWVGVRGVSWYRAFTFSVDGEQVGEARSMWVMLREDTHAIVRPNTEGADIDEDEPCFAPLSKLSVIDGALHHIQTARYSDLDINHHVNNVRIAEWVCDALQPDTHPGKFVSRLQINYTAEISPDEDISLLLLRQGEEWLVQGTGQGGERFAASADFSKIPTVQQSHNSSILDEAVQQILTCCKPLRIIHYAEKRTMTTDKLKQLSLCVIMPDGTDCRALRVALYLAVSLPISLSFNLYTEQEWQDLLADRTSFAGWISRKGQVIYDQTT